MYPLPSHVSNLSSPTTVSLTQLATLPQGAAPYGMINVSATTSGGSRLWFESGGYDPMVARLTASSSCRGSQCSQIPIQWNPPVLVSSTSSTVVADAVVSAGSSLVAITSTASTTYSDISTTSGASWSSLGSTISGVVQSVATNGTNLSMVTRFGSTWTVTEMGLTGVIYGSSTLVPSGSGATGILAAATSYLTEGNGSLDEVVFSVAGSDQIQVVNSTSPGAGFSSAILVGTFQDSVPNSALSSVGATMLHSAAAPAGQVGMTTMGNQTFLAFSTITGGSAFLETLGSGNGGGTWSPEYTSGPAVGTISNLTVAPSPAGLAYVAWREGVGSAAGVDEAIFFSNGLPMVAPTPLPGSSSPLVSPTGPPSIIVDSLQRPVLVWPSSTLSGNFIIETGAFLSPSSAFDVLEQVLTDPLSPGDFSSPSDQAAFNRSTSTSSSWISSNITSGNLCNAQNTTALTLYPEITHVPLLVVSNSGTTCGSYLSTRSSSPIANTSGADSPNVYLAVYSDWLLESEAVLVVPNALGNNTTGWSKGASPLLQPKAESECSVEIDTSGSLSCAQEDVGIYTMGATTFSPTSIEIDPSIMFGFPTLQSWSFANSCNRLGVVNSTPSTYTVRTEVVAWLNVSFDGGATHSYMTSGTELPWVYVTNLTPDTLYPYYASVTMRLIQTESGTWCGPSGSSIGIIRYGGGDQGTGATEWNNVSFSGEARTELYMWYPQFTLNSPTSSGGPAILYFGWRTSMAAAGRVQIEDLNDTSKVWTWSSSTYTTVEVGSLTFTPTIGDSFEITYSATSRAGGWSATQMPALAGGTHGSSAAQAATKVYGGGGTGGSVVIKPPKLYLWGLDVSNVTGTTAEVSWSSNVNAAGWAIYTVAGSGTSQDEIDLVGAEMSNHSAWTYTSVMHSLEPWSSYRVSYGVLFTSANITENASQTTSLKTSPVATVWESDLPYDSISHTGGGAAIRWTTSATFMAEVPTPTVTNGTLWIWNATASEVISIAPSELNQTPGSPYNDWLNVTLTGFNQSYGFVLQLNYSSTPSVTADSSPTYFVYQLDSSGDGLTNEEKITGWTVVNPNSGYSSVATADWSVFSTSGLYSDYVEKEYGLNPASVDTASSGMLDLWNLTFNLGANDTNPTVPDSYALQLFWEINTSFDPFSYAPYPGGPNLGGHPVATNLNNISCTPSTCAADSGYSAEVLWSSEALATLLTLPGMASSLAGIPPLRGVLGVYDGDRTLTIWGKLSWGADPQATYTPTGTGFPDGQRLSPTGLMGLTVDVQNLYVHGLVGGEGYAARFRLFPGTTPSGSWTLTNFTAPVGLSGGISRLTGYDVILPVSQTSQYETLQIQILANESASQPLTPIDFVSGGHNEVNLSYDMFGRGVVSETYGSPGYNPNGSLSVTIQSTPVGGKSATFLWLPTTNSTVNGLPAGLERYTGEQSFDLIVVNASTTITSDAIPLPWGGSYSLTLQAGLNTFLIPREQFLNSSFAAATLEANIFPYPANEPTPPIIANDIAAQNLLTQSFGTSPPLILELEAYWQNRSIATGPGNFTLTKDETGVPGSSSLQVRTLVVTSPPSNDTGGLLDDPNLYTEVARPAAVESVQTLNLTSTATLDLLLSALLTNTSAGVNGTFQTITSQVQSIGFKPIILNALANASTSGQGVYGPPPHSTQGRPANPWSSFWNAATSIVTNPAGTVLSLAGVIWSSGVAAFAYFAELDREANALLVQVLPRVASTLVSVGKMVVGLLTSFLTWIYTLIRDALVIVIEPILHAAQTYVSSLGDVANLTFNDVENGRSVSAAQSVQLMGALGGSILILGLAVGITVSIALSFLADLTLGPTVVLTLLLTFFTMSVLLIGAGLVAAAALSVATTWALDSFINTSFSANKGALAQLDWKAFAESLGLAATITESPLAFFLFNTEATSGEDWVVWPTLALLCDMIGLTIAGTVWLTQAPPLVVIALCVSVVGVLLSGAALARTSLSLQPFAALDLGLSLVAAGAAFDDLHQTF